MEGGGHKTNIKETYIESKRGAGPAQPPPHVLNQSLHFCAILGEYAILNVSPFYTSLCGS